MQPQMRKNIETNALLQAIDWVAREEERPGVVVEQLEQVPLLLLLSELLAGAF